MRWWLLPPDALCTQLRGLTTARLDHTCGQQLSGGRVGWRHRRGPAVSPPPQGSTNRCPEFNHHSTQDLPPHRNIESDGQVGPRTSAKPRLGFVEDLAKNSSGLEIDRRPCAFAM